MVIDYATSPFKGQHVPPKPTLGQACTLSDACTIFSEPANELNPHHVTKQ